MVEQKRLEFSEIAYKKINNKVKINRMTNEVYDTASKRADKRIEENNREYAATYKKAALFSAK